MKRRGLRRALGFIPIAALCLTIPAAAACAAADSQTYILSIEQTAADSGRTVYTITYSDGSTGRIEVADGKDGQDGKDLQIYDIWQAYTQATGSDIALADFIEQYLELSADSGLAVGLGLLSSVSVYSESVETTTISTGFPGMGGMGGGSVTSSQVALSGGSGVIYSIDESYAYIVTNYHVVYNDDADEQLNGGVKTGRKIICYLYGNEGTPAISGYDGDGLYVYEYGSQAIECTYMGGSLEADIAVLRADAGDLYAINDKVQAVTLADDYHVGQTVYAIGNADAYGISATAGIVSVDSEYISLDADGDGTYERHRAIRFDAAIYHGNSGGGLFNSYGRLIGINNAGSSSDENICYAVPLEVVKGTVESIIYYANDGDDTTQGAYRPDAGMEVGGSNSRYYLDEQGYGRISEDVYVESVAEGSLAEELGLAAGDRLTAIIINGTSYAVDRTFDVDDILLAARAGDSLQIAFERDGQGQTGAAVTILQTHLELVA